MKLKKSSDLLSLAVVDEEPYDTNQLLNYRQVSPNLYTIVEDKRRGQQPNSTQFEIQTKTLDWQQ
jgi:hypothetical protein